MHTRIRRMLHQDQEAEGALPMIHVRRCLWRAEGVCLPEHDRGGYTGGNMDDRS